MICYLINPEKRTVEQVEYDGLADLQRMVGGSIEVAADLPFGDVLYVNEEGLLRSPQYFFHWITRNDQLFAGNGVIVGQETDETGGVEGTDPPHMSLDLARRCVVNWYSR